jgi:hypothetical protein
MQNQAASLEKSIMKDNTQEHLFEKFYMISRRFLNEKEKIGVASEI